MTVEITESHNEILIYNCVNLGAYLVNAISVFGSELITPLNNPQMSEKYQTLITPAGSAFAIWGVIFLTELMFVVAQFFPAFRNGPLIRTITPFWVAACVFQTVWSPVFGFELHVPALICMYGILASLLLLIFFASSAVKTIAEEGVLLMGLGIHCGWILCASAVNTNVYLVSLGWKQPAQLSAAISCLAVVCSVAAVCVVGPRRCPNFWVPLVVVWASYWIGVELEEAKFLKDDTREFYLPWDQDILDGVRGASDALNVIGLVFAAAAVMIRVLHASLPSVSAKASSDGNDVGLSETL